jgi:hypothetical protein
LVPCRHFNGALSWSWGAIGFIATLAACSTPHPLSDVSPGDDAQGEPSPDATTDAGPASDTGRGDAGRVPYRAIAVATGELHTCVILTDHNVKCWGDGAYGQLGYGDMRYRGQAPTEMGDALPFVDLGTGRTALSIAAGRYATCAILDDSSLKCWGLWGLNGTNDRGNVGDEPGEMGDHLAPLDLGGRRPVHVAIGQAVACAWTDDQSIWCWDGQTSPPRRVDLGSSNKTVRALSADDRYTVMVLFDDGSVIRGLGGSAAPLDFGGRVVALAGSYGPGSCAILDDGRTVCIEHEAVGADLPMGAVALGTEFAGSLCALYGDGSVRCPGQCGSPSTSNAYWCDDGTIGLDEPASSITSGGSAFACALLTSGGVKCWGGDPTMSPPAWLGSSAVFGGSPVYDGMYGYRAWNDVDLGTHD